MGLGKLLESCITGVIVVNYCAQSELLIFYLREISLRMEEKTGDLNIIMKVTMGHLAAKYELVDIYCRIILE